MNTAMPFKQRGLSFSGFIFGAALLVGVSIFGLKLVPSYMQDARIKNIFVVMVNDLELRNASPRDIRIAFSKRADIEDITVIKPEDVEVTKDGDRLVLSASYAVTVPLVANASLYLEFNPSSDK